MASLRQIFAALRLGAVGVDRIHHQRRLHRHHRAVAGIDALDLARNQPVADVAEAGAAVFLRDGRAEEPEMAHLVDDLAIEALFAIGGEHAREQFLLRIGARGVAHHALVLGELALEIERVLPVEARRRSAARWISSRGRAFAGSRFRPCPFIGGLRPPEKRPRPLPMLHRCRCRPVPKAGRVPSRTSTMHLSICRRARHWC